MFRRLLIGLVIIAVISAAAWALWPRPVAVDVATIGRHSIEIFAEDEGKTRIRNVFTVSAPISGQMQRLGLEAGDQVIAQETVVATIRPVAPALLDARSRRVAEAAVAAARAAVDLASAELRQAEAQLRFLQGELQRATALVRRGTISERAFEKAKLDAETASAAVESAKAAHMVRQRELESAEAALVQGRDTGSDGECCAEVLAPVSGRVLRVLTESEQVVQAGMPLVEIGDPADIEIVADILSRDAVRIVQGAAASVIGWGGPPLAARVLRVEPSATTKVSALGIEEQRVNVVLNLDGDPKRWEKLGHGFRVVVRIELWRGDNLVTVPIGALFRVGADWAVYVIADSRAHLRLVTLGERNSDLAEIQSGLSVDEQVILHPSDLVADGTRVSANTAD